MILPDLKISNTLLWYIKQASKFLVGSNPLPAKSQLISGILGRTGTLTSWVSVLVMYLTSGGGQLVAHPVHSIANITKIAAANTIFSAIRDLVHSDLKSNGDLGLYGFPSSSSIG